MAKRGNARFGPAVRVGVGASRRRLVVGKIFLVLVLVATGGKLAHVQAVQAEELSKRAEQQRTTVQPIHAHRGSILDRKGNEMAFSTEARALYALPKKISKEYDELHAQDPSKPTSEQVKRDMAQFIAGVLRGQVTEEEVHQALTKDVTFTYFGPIIDPSQARIITDRYPQIGAEYRDVRQYPGGRLAAHIIGAANWRMDERKTRGLLGLEGAKDQLLAGQDGKRAADTELGSNVVIPGTERVIKPATDGSDLALTIDSDLQYTLQRRLSDYAQRAGAKGGSAVVLDAKTGEVRALANDKAYDPSDSSSWKPEELNNTAVTSPYEPGSVNKVITASLAIEAGIARPEDVLQVPGSITMNGSTVRDAWSHGTIPLTFTGVFGKSSNVGTLMTAQKIGKDRFADGLRKFGLGQPTGIGLPGESAGYVPPREEWSGSTFANLPIGQGLSMNVLQMAGMYQAIANDGVRIPPRVIDATVAPDGTRHEQPRPDEVRVVSKDTAKTVRDMLRSVVQDEPGQQGTGPPAALDGYQISGKTGTAQQIDPACACYSNSKYWITFTGMLPAQDPRYVVAIMLDAPSSGTAEAASAAPLFHDVAGYLAQRFQIPLSPKPSPVQILQPNA